MKSLRLLGAVCLGLFTLGLTMPLAAAPVVIFADNFDGETGSNVLNYD